MKRCSACALCAFCFSSLLFGSLVLVFRSMCEKKLGHREEGVRCWRFVRVRGTTTKDSPIIITIPVHTSRLGVWSTCRNMRHGRSRHLLFVFSYVCVMMGDFPFATRHDATPARHTPSPALFYSASPSLVILFSPSLRSPPSASHTTQVPR